MVLVGLVKWDVSAEVAAHNCPDVRVVRISHQDILGRLDTRANLSTRANWYLAPSPTQCVVNSPSQRLIALHLQVLLFFIIIIGSCTVIIQHKLFLPVGPCLLAAKAAISDQHLAAFHIILL